MPIYAESLTDDLVWIGGDVSLPRRAVVRVRPEAPADDLPFAVDLVVEVVEGELQVRDVAVHAVEGGVAVTGEGLRLLRLPELARAVADLAAVTTVDAAAGTSTVDVGRPVVTDADRAHVAEHGPDDESLRIAARAYAFAAATSQPPTRAVEVELRLTRSTAERWLRTARSRGLLDLPPRRTGRPADAVEA